MTRSETMVVNPSASGKAPTFGPSLVPGLVQTGPHSWKALCPCGERHEDNDPSLRIDLAPHHLSGALCVKYHCVACGANGTAVAAALGVKETWLYNRGNIPEYVPPPPEPLPTERQWRGWVRELQEMDGGYLLHQRGISMEVLRQYRVGFGTHTTNRLMPDGSLQSYQVKGYMLPVFNGAGRLVNLRIYRPDRKPKIRGLRDRGIQLFPVMPEGKWVLLCEGEVDALSALSYRLPALTTTGGVSSWKPEWTQALVTHGRPVAVCYDCQDISREAAAARVEELRSAGLRCVSIDLAPRRKDGYDLNDHLTSRASGERVVELVRLATAEMKRRRR